jgi:MFS family permease
MIWPHLHFHLGEYFPHHLTRAVKQLFGSVAILGFAISAVTVFEPIYYYTLGFSLRAIALYYLIVYVLYVLLLPMGTYIAAKHGYRISLLIGSLMFIPYYLAVFGVEFASWLFSFAPILLALQKCFYWPAFHANFARNITRGETGREIGEASLVSTVVAIIGPIVGGIIVAFLGFPWLFVIISLLVFLSNLPLFAGSRQKTNEQYSYRQAIAVLTAKENRRFVIAFSGYGEELIYLTFWPIFIYTIATSVLGVGSVMTASGAIVSFTLLVIGRIADQKRPQPIVHAGALAVSISSFLRIIAISAPLIVVSETAYRVSRAILDLPLLRALYERARKIGFLASASILEVGLSLGKIAVALVLIGIFSLDANAWYTVFLLGAVFALLFARFPSRLANEHTRRR